MVVTPTMVIKELEAHMDTALRHHNLTTTTRRAVQVLQVATPLEAVTTQVSAAAKEESAIHSAAPPASNLFQSCVEDASSFSPCFAGQLREFPSRDGLL